MIGALAADHAQTRSFAAGTMIGERQFQRGVGGFRSRVAEEGVVEIAGRQNGEAGGELENLGMAELERRSEVKLPAMS